MHKYKQLVDEAFENYCKNVVLKREPRRLYEPFDYFMHIGGKRMRPLLLLLAYNIYRKDVSRALDSAIAVELFHNFTLIHDDIMDNADLRRGFQTVHKKFGNDSGILVGDVMMLAAFELLWKNQPLSEALMRIYNRTAIEVCEGQQMDMDFQSRLDTTEAEYMEMIRLKTSVLLACALQMGGIMGEASDSDQKILYDFGIDAGLAFQLQDDFLDAFGDPKKVGKKPGGDILQNKKTLLVIHALTSSHRETLEEWYSTQKESDEKIDAVLKIFEMSGSKKYVEEKIADHFQRAFTNLKKLSIQNEQTEQLSEFAQRIFEREF